ncbi:prenyltransferase [Aestuariibacter salexigens]|uniref:prenyltransferase n=1 Tax=Aestuariibacter salexigens TaxID=226010 RepID=UPI00041FB326|nr:prenyltransferase [Aestuariibacter salexigens]
MSSHTIFATLQTMRPPFLLLALICVALGIASAVAIGADILISKIILAIIGGLSAHIAVNCLNEYQDYNSGLDLATTRTPFSGGSGALVDTPSAAFSSHAVAIVCLTVSMAIGVYFAMSIGWGIVPLGLLGITIIVSYTRWLNRFAYLCLIAPGLAFGPLMICGTHYVFSGDYSVPSLLISMVVFFLANNLLLLNQFPDVEADRQHGRNHLVIRHGFSVSILVYIAFWLASVIMLSICLAVAALPPGAAIGFLPLMLGAVVSVKLKEAHKHLDSLVPLMAINVIMTLLTPAVIAVSLLV